jgi:hypothetical protein
VCIPGCGGGGGRARGRVGDSGEKRRAWAAWAWLGAARGWLVGESGGEVGRPDPRWRERVREPRRATASGRGMGGGVCCWLAQSDGGLALMMMMICFRF